MSTRFAAASTAIILLLACSTALAAGGSTRQSSLVVSARVVPVTRVDMVRLGSAAPARTAAASAQTVSLAALRSGTPLAAGSVRGAASAGTGAVPAAPLPTGDRGTVREVTVTITRL